MYDFNYIDEELNKLQSLNLKRELKTIITANGPWVELSSGQRVLQFASNSYLGLTNHPDLINATKAAVTKYGVGSTGSRLLSGTLELHTVLEDNIALFQKSEGALFFTSGYAANVGVISSLLSPQDTVYSDELNHASIIDGIRLSGAHKFIYNHNDIEELEKLAQSNEGKYNRSFLVTDSVFGMNGDLAKLSEIAKVTEKYKIIPIVDEAHAIGVFGAQGAGYVSELKMEHMFPIRIGTCSKAVGVEGSFCVAPKNVIELLKNKARTFMFSTSSSPGVVGTVLKAIELVAESDWRREKLWQNAKKLHEGLSKICKLKIAPMQTPIIIIFFNSIEEALKVSKRLFEECHIWAPPIRPPSVKTPLIRLSPISTHSEEDIDYVIKAFHYIAKDLQPSSLNAGV